MEKNENGLSGVFPSENRQLAMVYSPEHRDLITTQVINDVKYLMIRVTGGVEVNGINIADEE